MGKLSDVAPNIDQHASCEVNTKRNLICNRGGAACDISVAGFENNMYEVAKWAASNLPFDRMYFYGNNRPFHISCGPDNNRFIQVMKTSKAGKRFPGKRGINVEFDSIVGDIDEPIKTKLRQQLIQLKMRGKKTLNEFVKT
ncbi:MAG: hypothetical protein QNK36_20175 [Colwellia sp.]|nr:hypothetical protein [Colwellia sp.]